MERGKVYKVTLQPLTTSNYFAAGHRLRLEVSSSNFPRFDRNLNTGGNNYDETAGVVAHNTVHHSKQVPVSGDRDGGEAEELEAPASNRVGRGLRLVPEATPGLEPGAKRFPCVASCESFQSPPPCRPYLSAQLVFRGTEIFLLDEFAARRTKVFAAIGDAVAVVQGTMERPGEEPLRQNNQFFYLTGVVEARAPSCSWTDARRRRRCSSCPPMRDGTIACMGLPLPQATRPRVPRASTPWCHATSSHGWRGRSRDGPSTRRFAKRCSAASPLAIRRASPERRRRIPGRSEVA